MKFERLLRDRDRWSIGEHCSMAKALDVLSTKTAFLIVRECFYGTTRFDDFVSRTGTSAPTISRALQHLERAQVITRVSYQNPGERAREAYELTRAGRDLLPVFLALVQWGDAHRQNGGAPLAFFDSTAQQQIGVRIAPHDEPPPATTSLDDIEIRIGENRRRRSRSLRLPPQ